MSAILKISNKYNIKIVEDCAQAQGAKFKNKFVGTFGDLGCFSFYPTKVLGAYSDGGFVLTNSFKHYQNVKKVRFYGIDTVNKNNKFFNKYYSNINGVNSRLDEINSEILNFKLKKIDTYIKKRRILANIYDKELKNTSLKIPSRSKDLFDVFHLYTVYHPKREKIINKLHLKGIQTRIIYPYPIHLMKGYKTYFKNKRFQETEIKSKRIFSLPLYPELKRKLVYKICKELKKILNDV